MSASPGSVVGARVAPSAPHQSTTPSFLNGNGPEPIATPAMAPETLLALVPQSHAFEERPGPHAWVAEEAGEETARSARGRRDRKVHHDVGDGDAMVRTMRVPGLGYRTKGLGFKV